MEVQALALLDSASRPQTVGELRARLAATPPLAAVDPEELWHAAEAHGCELTIAWSRDGARGSCDVTVGAVSSLPATEGPWRRYANRPHRPFSDAFVAELKTYLRDRVPSYMVPAHLVCLDRWPLTANGKVDTAKLPRRHHRAERATAAPQASHVRALAEMWSDMLGVDSVAPDDNFFDLGGDSLKAIELAHRASRQFGVALSPVSVFERPTLAALAGLLHGPAGPDPAASAEAARARGAARRNRGGR
jgi:aryl carrier-like protein